MDTTIIGRHCSSNLEYLMVKCRLFYLPRDFTSTVVTAASIPLDANTKTAMKEVHTAVSKQHSLHPQAAFIVVGDFNNSNLKTVLPKFHQHVSLPPEETRLWKMSSPTCLRPTKLYPYSTLNNLSISQ